MLNEDEMREADRRQLEAALLEDGVDPANFAPGSLGFHEALHASHMAREMFETHVLEHPAIVFDAKAYALAVKAFDALWAVYQHLGAQQPAGERQAPVSKYPFVAWGIRVTAPGRKSESINGRFASMEEAVALMGAEMCKPGKVEGVICYLPTGDHGPGRKVMARINAGHAFWEDRAAVFDALERGERHDG